jgi:protease-4
VSILVGLAAEQTGIGAVVGAPFGPDTTTPGWIAGLRLEAASRRGMYEGRVLLDREIGPLGARGLVALLLELDAAARDERVAAVLLRFRGSDIGSAYAQEIRQAIERLASLDKPVVCHLDDASGAEHYACAAADAIFLDPAGGVRIAGPSVEALLLGDVLRDAGLRAEFLRIGRYKSAPEQLTNASNSAPAREQREALYDDVFRRVTSDYARDLDLPVGRVRALIDEGPFVTPRALARGLAWGEADARDMAEELRDVIGRDLRRAERLPERVPETWATARRLGVVVVDGDIVDGENVDVPFVGVHLSGADTVVAAIDALAGDSTVGAIVLRVDSPGGSALASDQIWRALRRARDRKPVVASMGAIAASGGYYVASAANEIWADPSTITGSIGIFFGKVDVGPLAERLGVTIERTSRGRHAGIESLYRPFTADDRVLVADAIRVWYRLFLRRIEAGRGMAIPAIDAVARGRVWSGDAAHRRGLVDHLGGLGSALARARVLADLPDDCPVTVVPERPSTLLDYVLADDPGSARAAAAVVPEELRAAVQLAFAMAHVREGVGLARADAQWSVD